MSSWYRGFALVVFAALMATGPALADNARASSAKNAPPALAAPAAAQLPAAQSESAPSPKPVLTARVPFESTWNSTVLAANSQAMGLQASRVGPGSPIRWAIAGAAVGAIVGAVAGDPLTDAALGGVIGFGASYVMRH